MSHIRPEERSVKKSRSSCRRGRHHYGPAQNIGGGILRRVCEMCSEVTIDLTSVEEDQSEATPSPSRIRARTRGDS